MKLKYTPIIALASAFLLAGCGDSTPTADEETSAAKDILERAEASAEAASERVEEASEAIAEASRDAAAATQETASDAGAAIQEAASDAADATKDAYDSVVEDMSTEEEPAEPVVVEPTGGNPAQN